MVVPSSRLRRALRCNRFDDTGVRVKTHRGSHLCPSRLPLGTALLFLACAPSPPASAREPKASSAPVRDFIEPVCEADGLMSRDAALALLERSLARWRQLRDGWAGRYGYLRSYSFGSDHYQHTFFEVEQGAVVERRCRDYPNGQSEYHLYYEGPRDIGEHDECHAPLSIESLHEECRAIIEHAPGAVRFAAHPDGLLGICGLPESCCQPDSATCVSVRAAYRLGEAPCFDHALLRPQGWTFSGAGTVPSRACHCRDSMLACDD